MTLLCIFASRAVEASVYRSGGHSGIRGRGSNGSRRSIEQLLVTIEGGSRHKNNAKTRSLIVDFGMSPNWKSGKICELDFSA